ncbi:MAG: hypothetical protein ACRDJM_07200 [Actinomycetota bacterium]
MKRILLAAAVAALGTLGGVSAQADTYCFRTGLTIMGEPWLAHEECADCPTQDCPPVPVIPDRPDDPGLPVWVTIEVSGPSS